MMMMMMLAQFVTPPVTWSTPPAGEGLPLVSMGRQHCVLVKMVVVVKVVVMVAKVKVVVVSKVVVLKVVVMIIV